MSGLLDGNADGVTGDDFTATFVVDHGGSRHLSLRDITRAPGQSVDLTPASTSDLSLPIRINDATGVLSVDAELEYDPSLLQVDTVVKPGSLPADWDITFNLDEPGRLRLNASGPTPLAGEDLAIFDLIASVSDDAPYGVASTIELTNVSVNENVIQTLGDVALLATILPGDATGDKTYSGLDSALISRVIDGLDTGFEAFPTIDPDVIASIVDAPGLDPQDADKVSQKAVGLPVPELPEIPAGLVPDDLAGSPVVVTASSVDALPGEMCFGTLYHRRRASRIVRVSIPSHL